MRMGRLGGYYDLKNYRGFNALVANTVDIRDWIVGPGLAARARPPHPQLRRSRQGHAAGPLGVRHAREGAAAARHGTAARVQGARRDAEGAGAPARRLAVDRRIGPLQRELEKLARDLGVAERVRGGLAPGRSALYRTADMCVFPSRIEPLGMW
jgi:glycosyltransferase involved in cell wall biosynthesis